MNSTKADREKIQEIDGLYIGLLDKYELESFERCIQDKLARRDYTGTGGLLGLAKVKCLNV